MFIVTMRKDVPPDTIKMAGFHLLDMGKEGKWLVDERHPGYRGCVKKAIAIATAAGNKDLVEKYLQLPSGLENAIKPVKLQFQIDDEEKENEKLKILK